MTRAPGGGGAGASDSLRMVERGRPDAPPVLLLHGFTGSAQAWGEEILARLSAHARVLAVDLPGHGGSPAPEDPGAYRLEGVVRRVLEVMDRSGTEQADWVGYSMGARVALGAAVIHPQRVRRLVLESASPGLSSARDRDRRRRQDEALARRLEARGIEPFVEFWMDQPLFATQRRLPREVRERERARRLAQDPRALARVLRGLGTGSQPSFWDELSRVEVPTLLMTGSEDEKFGKIAGRMVGEMSRAVHRSVRGVGHTVHLEAPERWLEVVLPFLRARGSSPVTPVV